MARLITWVFSRVGVIYIIVLFFCLTCVDFKMLTARIKLRHLNDSIPDFGQMIVFSKDQNAVKDLDWKPYKNYFELIQRYMPDDLISKQLLGYVDYYSGEEQQAVSLFKSSDQINGRPLFWPDYNLGVIYYKKGMWPEAVEYLFKAIASSPQLAVWLMQDSIIYRQIAVSQLFKYSLSDEIKDAQSSAYLLLLSSLYRTGQYDKVIAISNLGIANPDLSYKDAFYYYAGLAFLATGQVKEAFLLFQKSLTIEKGNPDVYYDLAGIYEKAGQLEQARDFLQISYALHKKGDPRFPYEDHVRVRFF